MKLVLKMRCPWCGGESPENEVNPKAPAGTVGVMLHGCGAKSPGVKAAIVILCPGGAMVGWLAKASGEVRAPEFVAAVEVPEVPGEPVPNVPAAVA